MNTLPTTPLKESPIWTPRNINDSLYTRKSRKIWTKAGEFDVPIKKKKTRGMMLGTVTDIWFKDERGELILFDPVGEDNTITNGAIYEMMQILWGQMVGYTNAVTASAFSSQDYTNVASNYGAVSRPQYSDGTYNFPSTQKISSTIYNSSTYYSGFDVNRAFTSLFGQLYFLNGSSGGLTGDHIPASVTFGTGFNNKYINNNATSTGYGWNDSNGLPTIPIGTTNTTLSDSFSTTNSGTPTMSHSMTLAASNTARSFTFDGIAWVPCVSWGAQNGIYYMGGYWAAGNPLVTNPTWASANANPTTATNVQVSALWNPGYAVTLNPNGSWGFTYQFQG